MFCGMQHTVAGLEWGGKEQNLDGIFFVGVDVIKPSDEDTETSLGDISLSLEYISPTGLQYQIPNYIH